MDFIGNLVQGVGIFICIGGLLIGFLAFLLFRGISNRVGNTRDYQRPGTLGTDRDIIDQPDPIYDDRSIETRAGYGNVPSTGDFRDLDADQTRDRNQDLELDRERDVDPTLPNDRDLDRDLGLERPRRDDDDDEDIRSSGGFGRQ